MPSYARGFVSGLSATPRGDIYITEKLARQHAHKATFWAIRRSQPVQVITYAQRVILDMTVQKGLRENLDMKYYFIRESTNYDGEGAKGRKKNFYRKDCVSFFLRLASDAKLKFAMISAKCLAGTLCCGQFAKLKNVKINFL